MTPPPLSMEQRLAALEERMAQLESQNRDLVVRQRDQAERFAYLYIHFHWLWIRWVLTRDQDRLPADIESARRAKACEDEVWLISNRRLREVKFASDPFQLMLDWRIECTRALNRHRFTFLD